MAVRRYNFESFSLDPAERRLFNAQVPVELNSRYFDALLLMIEHPVELLSKDRFLQEIWQGISVTDRVSMRMDVMLMNSLVATPIQVLLPTSYCALPACGFTSQCCLVSPQ